MAHGRRLLLLTGAKVTALAALAALGPAPAGAAAPRNAPYPFTLGVASGSPLPDSVILWTRILSDPLDANPAPPVAMPFPFLLR